MGGHDILLVVVLLFFGDVVISTRNLSKEDDFDMETDIKLLNKSIQVGTTLIRNTFKSDYIKEIESSKAPITGINYNTYSAVARTKDGPHKYSGVGSYIKIENPKVTGQQYTATRIKLQSGPDSIEAGWRVDPGLYGDSQTRLYIRTDAGDIHCFNTRCSGFIQTSHEFSFDKPLKNFSIPGDMHVNMDDFYIIKDNKSGNWNLFRYDDKQFIGYWPTHIFTKLTNLADRVEWGGIAHSPPGAPLPPMGSGNHPIGDPTWDGTICRMKIFNEKGEKTDPTNIEIYTDNFKLYSVRIIGYVDENMGYTVLYGGSGH